MLQHLKSWWATHLTVLGAVVSFLDPSIQNLIAQHPGSSVLAGAAWAIILHQLQPPRNFPKAAAGLILFLVFGSSAQAQTPAPADIPVTHVTISASFTGYDSNGKMVPATVDTFGVAVFRNKAATFGVDADYEHVAVPALGQRWELGVACPWFSIPKIKGLLFDTSNFVGAVCAGAGKLLSASDGNRFAYTVAPSISYPIAGHMTWTISYQYLKANGGISGLVNRSSQSVSTGPVLHF